MKDVQGPTNGQAPNGAVATLLAAPVRLAASLAGGLARQAATGGCEIPAPCWEPRLAGSCSLVLTPGGTGTVRVHIRNCGWARQLVGITAAGKLAGIVQFQPTTLIVDPQSQASFLVRVRAPDAKTGGTVAGPLLVRGCRDHFARIQVSVAECAERTCCDIVIDDCADHVHHWYDHFYCPRPCRTPSRATVTRNG